MGTVDDDGTKETGSILSAIVRMVPAAPPEVGLECIRERFAWSDRALSHGWNTVVPRSRSLENSMPVQCSPFFRPSNLVMNGDLESIPPVGFKGRPRELAVDQDNASVDAIRRNVPTGDCQVVCTDNACVSVSLVLKRP